MSDDTTSRERRTRAAVQELLVSWGRYLAEVRRAKGMSQAQLAASQPGLDQAGVSRAEKGKGGIGIGVALLMAEALDVSIPELAAGAAELDRRLAEEGAGEAA